MATVKDAKLIAKDTSKTQVQIFFSFTFFYLHFFFWLILIACFGIVAEF
jgi:hypothetical protein